MKPEVSIIISNKNHGKYLARCIESIENQSFSNYEIIITDDASTDISHEILKKYKKNKKFKIFFNDKSLGLTVNLINMIKFAKGNFICRQDSDDISDKFRIEIILDLFKKNQNLVLISSSPVIIDKNGFLVKKTYQNRILVDKAAFSRGNILTHGSVMFKKKAYLNVGGYDMNFKYSQDYELWLRLISQGNFQVINNEIYHLRIHDDSISNLKTVEQSLYALLAYIKNFVKDDRLYKILLKKMHTDENDKSFFFIDQIKTLKKLDKINMILSLLKKNQIDLARNISRALESNFHKRIFLMILNPKVFKVLKNIKNCKQKLPFV